MPKPNLLLCFDAFGTLFKPKGSVAQQYAEIARQCGMANITEKELQPHLGAALKAEMKQNPNYGKATGLGATRWWTNVCLPPPNSNLQELGLMYFGPPGN
jgi:hypothetical protein